MGCLISCVSLESLPCSLRSQGSVVTRGLVQPRAEPGLCLQAPCLQRPAPVYSANTAGCRSFHVPANVFVEMLMMFHAPSLQGKHWVTANKVVMARVGSMAQLTPPPPQGCIVEKSLLTLLSF